MIGSFPIYMVIQFSSKLSSCLMNIRRITISTINFIYYIIFIEFWARIFLNFNKFLPPCITNHILPPFSVIRNKWFLNLSSVMILHNIQCFLQLGDNFALPNKNKGRILIECIKNIEHNIRKFSK